MSYDDYLEEQESVLINRIERAFEEGKVDRDGLQYAIHRSFDRLSHAATVAPWVSETHGDEITDTRYKAVDETDESFPSLGEEGERMVIGRYLHTMRIRDDPDAPADLKARWVWNDERTKAWVVFNDDPDY
jgi:hypothetical protein